MKKLNSFILLGLLFSAHLSFSQETINLADSTGLAGDQFSLEGALEMFKASTSLEDFEKKLNTEDNVVNNLDLNGDNEIDYIRVIDKMEGTAHVIIMQVAVSETESQDIAVIEIEKNGEESAVLQIIGDEELYGDSVIVEPYDAKEIEEGKSSGQGPSSESEITRIKIIIVNVWGWPCVRYIYAPGYVVWASPYRWHYYPMGWKPWRPHPWRWHYAKRVHYRAGYRAVYMRRVAVAHRMYRPHRTTSVIVRNRYRQAHVYHGARRANAAPVKMRKGPAQASPKPGTKAAPQRERRASAPAKTGRRNTGQQAPAKAKPVNKKRR